MKPIKRIFIAITFLSLALTILIAGCTSKSKEQGASSQEQGSSTKKEVAQKEVWTCPMHPQIRKEGPGQCPICGMNLVKVDTSEEANSGASGGVIPESHAPFSLSAERSQMIGV